MSPFLELSFAVVIAVAAQTAAPPPPKPMPDGAAPAVDPADKDRQRIESMFQMGANRDLKGKVLEETFRPNRVRENPDPLAEPVEEPGPHEFGFRAALPTEDNAIAIHLDSAEPLGPKRYRLNVRVFIPFDSIGGHYKLDTPAIPIGWKIDQVLANVEVSVQLDLGWKLLENGNVGIFPGAFVDPDVPEEEKKAATLIEAIQVDVQNLDLSKINLDGINGRRTFYRDGQPVGRGLVRFLKGAAEQVQLNTIIEGGLNKAIRSREADLLVGINSTLQAELPETQIQITKLLDKIAFQANLRGKDRPSKPPAPPKPDPPVPQP